MRILLPACKWNLATDDLDWGEFGRNCIRWADNYERSLLPPELIFPQANQIWEAARDCEVNFNAFFTGPPAGKLFMLPTEPLPFGKTPLTKGERVRIGPINEARPMTIWFTPLRYFDLQTQIVPEGVLRMTGYSNYTLSLRFAGSSRSLWPDPQAIYFSETFRLIEVA
jgi:hypothetical protein